MKNEIKWMIIEKNEKITCQNFTILKIILILQTGEIFFRHLNICISINKLYKLILLAYNQLIQNRKNHQTAF